MTTANREQSQHRLTVFDTAVDREALSTLRGGSLTPHLVMLHPAGGTAGGLRRLVPAIETPRHVVAFEVFEPGPEHRCSVHAIAADYTAELLAEYPSCGYDKPLCLIGWSFGGLLAIEMAGLLEAEGRNVGHVVLLDSGTPAALATRRGTQSQNVAAMLRFPAHTVASNATLEEVLERVASQRSLGSLTRVTPLDLMPFVQTYLWHVAAMRAPWEPSDVCATVTLVRAADEHGWGRDTPRDLGWPDLLGREVPVLWTDGDHYGMTDDVHIPALAHVLAEILPLTASTGLPGTA